MDGQAPLGPVCNRVRMPTVQDLVECADAHLAHYVDPTNSRAFATYDRTGDPGRIEPTDILAPALLDAAVPGRHVIAMYLPTGPHRRLREALDAVVTDPEAADARFEDQDLDAEAGPWALVKAALVASNDATGFRAAKVTKILHRKRPHLVPIFDSKVAWFYGVPARRPWELWPKLQAELRNHSEWLLRLGDPYRTPDRRRLSELRVLDIVVWEHTQKCP